MTILRVLAAKWPMWFASTLASLLFSCRLWAQAPRLQPLTAADRSELKPILDRRPLPGGARFVYPDLHQSFALMAKGKRLLTLVPVVYATQGKQPGQGIFRNCGVYDIGPDKEIRLVTTLGPELSGETRCDSVEAIGLKPGESAMQRVLLVYSVSSPSASLHFGAVLRWDGDHQQYGLDEATTADFGGPVGTALSIRRMQKQLTDK